MVGRPPQCSHQALKYCAFDTSVNKPHESEKRSEDSRLPAIILLFLFPAGIERPADSPPPTISFNYTRTNTQTQCLHDSSVARTSKAISQFTGAHRPHDAQPGRARLIKTFCRNRSPLPPSLSCFLVPLNQIALVLHGEL